jgi:hypothetical protein
MAHAPDGLNARAQRTGILAGKVDSDPAHLGLQLTLAQVAIVYESGIDADDPPVVEKEVVVVDGVVP